MTYEWEFGNDTTALWFTVTYDDSTNSFTVDVLAGALNLNALYLSGAGATGNYLEDGSVWNPTKSDNSLNMNGDNTVWDDDGNATLSKETYDLAIKLSSAGLGNGTDWYLTAGDAPKSFDFDIDGLTITEDTILGVRATSVDGYGSIKWVDEHAVEEEVNSAPTDIRLDIDLAFAAKVNGIQGMPSDALNTTTGLAPEGGLIIGILSAVDPDPGDTFTYAIVGTNPGDRFVIDGNMLKLDEGKEIKQGDGTFQLTIEVTDSVGNKFYETFTFIADTNAAITVNGTSTSGTGASAADPKLGDDIVFGFVGADTLNGDSGDDSLFGGTNADRTNGGDGDDQLFGGVQADTLVGGPGNDISLGGDGADNFFMIAPSLNGTDTILDILQANGDRIGLLQGGDGWDAANTIASPAGTTLNALDYVNTGRNGITDIVAGDTNKVVELQQAQTTTTITTLVSASATPVNAYLLLFNSDTGRGELWYDSDWSDAGGRVQVATLDDVDTLAELTGFTAAKFAEWSV